MQIDGKALFNIGYGLYVVTTNDGVKDNGLIVNSVMQITASPLRVVVAVNKSNYSFETIKNTKKLNLNCLTTDAPFSIFERFGFSSGKDTDKFSGFACSRSGNGLAVLNEYINSFMSLDVNEYLDFGTHGMFVCSVTEAKILLDNESVTYAYYQKNIKPKPQTVGKKGYVCKICSYVHNGELTPDFICPICKHGAVDFEEIK